MGVFHAKGWRSKSPFPHSEGREPGISRTEVRVHFRPRSVCERAFFFLFSGLGRFSLHFFASTFQNHKNPTSLRKSPILMHLVWSHLNILSQDRVVELIQITQLANQATKQIFLIGFFWVGQEAKLEGRNPTFGHQSSVVTTSNWWPRPEARVRLTEALKG